MKTLVERIRNRELAIENDGSLEELRKVLEHCFPCDTVLPSGIGKYFLAVTNYKDTWMTSNDTYIDTISVKEVLAEIEGNSSDKLPKKWCVKVDNQLVVDYCNEHGEMPPYIINKTVYAHFPSIEGCTTSDVIEEGYTEITLNQFKKWILEEKPEPKSKVIYLNEEDRPKIEEPLSFVEWQKEKYNYFRDNNGILALGDRCLNKSTKEYAEYRNNFKPNDKPIEFTYHLDQQTGEQYEAKFNPDNFDIVLYVGNGLFWCTDKGGEGTVSVFKGNLNNGKVN